MRIIKVPEAVVVPDADTPESKDKESSKEVKDRTVTMREFLMIAVGSHKHFGVGIAGVRQGLKVAAAVDAANATIVLEDAEYKELAAAVEAASYNPAVARYLLPFYEAVNGAATETAKAAVP